MRCNARDSLGVSARTAGTVDLGERRNPVSFTAILLLALLLAACSSAAPVHLPPTATAGSAETRLKVYVGAGSLMPGVYALRADDGQVRWRYATSAGMSVQEHDDVIYATGGDGSVLALQASDGTLLWHRQLDKPSWDPPAVGDGTIYVATIGGSGVPAAISALAARDGTMRWRFQAEPGVGITSPPALAAGVVYFGAGFETDKALGGYLYALRASVGQLLWRFQTRGNIALPPAIDTGVVYVGSDDHTLYALRATDSTVIWRFGTGGAVMTAPAVAHGVVYFASRDGAVYAVRAADGAFLWRYATGADLPSPPAAAANGVVYVGFTDGYLYALDATSGALLRRYRHDNDCAPSPACWAHWTMPVLLDGLLYAGVTYADTRFASAPSRGYVYAFNLADGALQWQFRTSTQVWAPVIGP